MASDEDASVDFTMVDRTSRRPEAAVILNPDGHAADSSFPSLVLLDGSGVAGSYVHAHGGYESPPLEQLRDGAEKEVYREQAMHPSADDGLAAGNVEYADEQILQPVRKTVSIADIFAKNQTPQQQEPQDPPIGFYDPPHLPESFPRDPVPQGGKGEGWPYAPQGWPKPDDKWGWRVGQRAAANSLWIDRYVTVPVSLMKGIKPTSDEQFASKSRLVEYLRQTFPQMKDPNSIFRAFDWKVPAPKNFEAPEKRGPTVKRDKTLAVDGDDTWQKSKKQCRAGNLHCPLTKPKYSGSELLERLVCNICCSEPNFCRKCKCILCCKFFAPDADDISIIRCLNSPLSEPGSPSCSPICGHAAHLECALNSRLAGVIKKNSLYLEYMCRRCDRKTDLKETISRLVSEFMSKTVTESVETSLQLLLRVVQDPEDGESSIIQEILIGALKKVQEGADIVESCKELTEQLLKHLELQSGQGIDDNQMLHQVPNWSRARGRKGTYEDSLHSYETSVDKRVSQSKSVGSPDAQATFMFQENNISTSAINTEQACLTDTSPAVHRIDSTIICKEFGGENGVTATSGTRFQTDLNLDKQLSSTSLQDSLGPEDVVLSMPTDLLSCAPLLSSLLSQSVCKPPTLLIEDHIRECEAMTDRVRSAGQFVSSPSIFSVSLPGTLEALSNLGSKPPSLTASSLTDKYHGNQELVNPVVEAPDDTHPASAEKLVTSIPSNSRAESPSLSNSQDADDEIANTGIIEVRKSSGMRPAARSSSEREKSPSLSSSEDADDEIANTGIIEVRKSSRMRPAARSSSRREKSPSLSSSEDTDDEIAITEVRKSSGIRLASRTNSGHEKSPILSSSEDADDEIAITEIIEVRKSPRMRPATRSSSRRAKSPSLSSSEDADDEIANTGVIEVRKSPRMRPATRSSSRRAKSPSLSSSEDADDEIANTGIIKVRKSPRMRPATRSSSRRAKSPSFTSSEDADDEIANTGIIKVRKSPRMRPATRSSSRRTKSPSLSSSEDADDAIANTGIIEVRKSPIMRPATRSSFRRATSPSLSSSQDEGGDPTASTKTRNVSESSRKMPPTSSSGGIVLSLANSRDVGGDDVVSTQIMEVPRGPEPLQIIELALETTDTAGFEAEFEDLISEVLEKLKLAQAAEYARAEESLRAQKKIVIEQYQQFYRNSGRFAKKHRTQLFPHQFKKGQRSKSRAEFHRAMNRLMAQYGKAQEEQKVFASMLAISNGFGQVSKEYLRHFFKWSFSDITEA